MITLNLRRNKIYEYIRNGDLKAYRLGGHGRKDKYNRKQWRVKQEDLCEFLNRGLAVPTAGTEEFASKAIKN
jgi:hypothetical protein